MRVSAVASARRVRRIPLLLSCAGVVAGAAVFGLAVAGTVVREEASAAPVGAACLTWQDPMTEQHKLSRVDHGDGARVTVASLPYRVNAVGFAEKQEALYGLTPTRGDGSGPDLIRIDREGRTRDIGPVKGEYFKGLSGAYVGDVVGDRLVVLADAHIVSIGIDPANTAEFGSIVDSVRVSTRPRFGDWSYDASDGKLYGISSTAGGTLVSVEPASGRVVLRPVRGLPRGGFYGATFLVPGRTLYAVIGDSDGRAVLYRVALDGGEPAVPVVRWPALDSADAAYCPRPVVDPTPTSSPTPSPSTPSPSLSPSPSPTTPPPSPSVSPSVSPPPSPRASPPPPAPSVPGPAPRRPPPPPAPLMPPPLPVELVIPVPPEAPVKTSSPEDPHRKRAMVLGAVLMALSGSAGARSLRRR
ncbi:hypothetical protein AB0I28_08760 [Phytomonospora sp. NPDC050363]|uniref:DUF6923 family protein n=1 Tax=Phytomonospora sp. NPDC050363 TaxID=3155642 RepID=UPI0033EFAC33